MGKNEKQAGRRTKNGAASVSTQKDADDFKKSASAWGREATKTKRKARDTLVSLGISTPKGRLTKRYA